MKIQWIHVSKWYATWLFVFGVILLFLSGFDMEIADKALALTIDTKKTALEILWNNSLNFLGYFLLFPFSVCLLLYELIVIGVSLSMGYQMYGFREASALLLPHGLLEFPNILFYSYLAFHLWRMFWKRPRLSTILETIVANRYYYVGSYGLVVVAAFLEGTV